MRITRLAFNYYNDEDIWVLGNAEENDFDSTFCLSQMKCFPVIKLGIYISEST